MNLLFNTNLANTAKILSLMAALLLPTFAQAEVAPVYPQKQLQQALKAAGPGKVFLFDLDDTLFSTKNRNFKIFKAFVGDKANCKGMVALCKHIDKNLLHRHTEWQLQLTLKNLGLNAEQMTQFVKSFQGFWAARFFSNDWVKHDFLIPGAKEYVQKVYDSGAIVFYLTGRNNEKMRAGTEEAIRKAGLPYDQDRVYLEMKPGDTDDTTFKKTVFEKVASLGKLVAAYENEPRNIMAMADYADFQGGKFFFLDTLNSGEDVDLLASRTDLIWTFDFK